MEILNIVLNLIVPGVLVALALYIINPPVGFFGVCTIWQQLGFVFIFGVTSFLYTIDIYKPNVSLIIISICISIFAMFIYDRIEDYKWKKFQEKRKVSFENARKLVVDKINKEKLKELITECTDSEGNIVAKRCRCNCCYNERDPKECDEIKLDEEKDMGPDNCDPFLWCGGHCAVFGCVRDVCDNKDDENYRCLIGEISENMELKELVDELLQDLNHKN